MSFSLSSIASDESMVASLGHDCVSPADDGIVYTTARAAPTLFRFIQHFILSVMALSFLLYITFCSVFADCGFHSDRVGCCGHILKSLLLLYFICEFYGG